MPHIRFDGDLDPRGFWDDPPAITLSVPEEGIYIKYRETFLGAASEACLFRYVVAEGRLTQHLQVVLARRRGGGWILKLDRTYPVLRTPGVKLLLGIMGGALEERGLAVESANLSDFLDKGRFYWMHRSDIRPPPGDADDDPLYREPPE